MNAREQILGTIRAGLRGATPAALPPATANQELAPAERLERFTTILTRIGGRVDHVEDLAAAARLVRSVLEQAGAQRIATSDASELTDLTTTLPTSIRVLPVDAPRDELLAADAGVTFAQWGIAETGTLVLLSANERNRLASLLPALHIAVLPLSRLLGTLSDAFTALRAADGSPCSRTITFITGPSRTADIELTLVVGVHGPKNLHVVVVRDA